MARGGYRKPNNPAPVSGPGKLSRRTDGGPGSKQAMQEIRTGKYGESKALAEQQQGAPLAGSPTPTPRVEAPAQRPAATQLFAPTERPTEPVSAGMPFGAGPNSLPSPSFGQQNAIDEIKAIYAQYPSPELARIVQIIDRTR